MGSEHGFNLYMPGRDEINEFIEKDKYFEKIIKEQIEERGPYEHYSGQKSVCFKKGVVFMNRCGPSTRHKTVVKGHKLVFTKHKSKEDLEASKTTAELASMKSDKHYVRKESDKHASESSCGMVLKNWSEGKVQDLPAPMQPIYLMKVGDAFGVRACRLFRTYYKKLPKELRLKHNPDVRHLHGEESVKYVLHQLAKFGLRGGALSHPDMSLEDRRKLGSIVEFMQIFGEPYCTNFHKQINDKYFIDFGFDCMPILQNSFVESMCPDCVVESMVGMVLATAVYNRMSAEKAYKSQQLTLRMADAVNNVNINSNFNHGPWTGFVPLHYQDKRRPIDRAFYKTVYYRSTSAINFKAVEKSVTEAHVGQLAVPVPLGNAGATDYFMHKLRQLLDSVAKYHPEIDKYDSSSKDSGKIKDPHIAELVP